MTGGYVSIYAGARRHRDDSFCNSARKLVAHIERSMFSAVKSLARNNTFQNIGKKPLPKCVEVTANVAVDALQGRNVGESIRDHSRQAALIALVGRDKPRKLAMSLENINKGNAKLVMLYCTNPN